MVERARGVICHAEGLLHAFHGPPQPRLPVPAAPERRPPAQAPGASTGWPACSPPSGLCAGSPVLASRPHRNRPRTMALSARLLRQCPMPCTSLISRNIARASSCSAVACSYSPWFMATNPWNRSRLAATRRSSISGPRPTASAYRAGTVSRSRSPSTATKPR